VEIFELFFAGNGSRGGNIDVHALGSAPLGIYKAFESKQVQCQC